MIGWVRKGRARPTALVPVAGSGIQSLGPRLVWRETSRPERAAGLDRESTLRRDASQQGVMIPDIRAGA
jgi:hypothetical protein